MNELPCGQCMFYDPILSSGEKHKGKGWCVKKSKYPFAEGPGQIFPRDAVRVERGKLAEPYIVKDKQVIAPCSFARKAGFDQVKAKQSQQITKDKSGKRILT